MKKKSQSFFVFYKHNATDVIDRHFFQNVMSIKDDLCVRKAAARWEFNVVVRHQKHKLKLTKANLSLLKM